VLGLPVLQSLVPLKPERLLPEASQLLLDQQPSCLSTHQLLAHQNRFDSQDYRVAKQSQYLAPTMRPLETFVATVNVDRFDACLFYSP
jgi:hypothetical protein